MDLACVDLEGDAFQRDDARIRLDDVREAENDAGSRHRRYGFPYLAIVETVSWLEG